jgi:glycosyltransferase involved in cell wall biosynthesis
MHCERGLKHLSVLVQLEARTMRILVVHNYYQARGGEDTNREAEMQLLREAGHEVVEYTRHNNEILEFTPFAKAKLGLDTVWASRTYRELGRIIERTSPAVVHFHNTFPLISPSAYYACRQKDVPVVQTLQNFRLLCPGGNFLRSGRVCEDCQSHSLLSSIAHGCYRGSRVQTGVVAGMLGFHRVVMTWSKLVNQYVTCTNFARAKFLAAGFPGQLLSVKPNFIASDPGAREGRGNNALFVGRFSEEKGPQLLPEAWAKLPRDIPFEFIGDGPMRGMIEDRCRALKVAKVSFHGWLGKSELLGRLKNARFLIVPSVCYEGFPLAIVEAFGCGVPVIASRLGSMAEIVVDGKTGLHFTAGDAADLAVKVEWAWKHPGEMEEMGRAARREYEEKYTPEINYKLLMEIYQRAIVSENGNLETVAAAAGGRGD